MISSNVKLNVLGMCLDVFSKSKKRGMNRSPSISIFHLYVILGNRYVIETDGLVIKSVRKEDGGTYTCRARVPHTGELEERNIMLDVQEPPKWVIKPFDVEGVESDKVEFKCQALGHPVPSYSWVNWEGIDVRQKEGLCPFFTS